MSSSRSNNFPNDMFPARTIARPIKNLGNTCYMNAVLQALAHAPELCLAMDCEPHCLTCPIAAENNARQQRTSGESSPSSSPENTSINNYNTSSNNNAAAAAAAAAARKPGTRKSLRSGRKSPQEVQEETQRRRLQFCALCEVEKHVKKVHDATLRDKPVAPSTFVDGFIDFVAPWFKPGVQEDSHEFLRLLIDSMQKSCERARVSAQQDNPQDDSPTSARPTSGGGAAQGDDKDSEYPFSLFRGTVESIVTCESCNASSSTLDPIEDIGLEVTMPTNFSTSGGTTTTSDRSSSRNSSPTPAPALADVQTAFQRFARPEPLDAGYKCEKCGLVGRATKQSRLASIPPILTLHLKRFRYGTAADANMMNVSSSAAATAASGVGSANSTSNSATSSTVATRRTPRSEVGQLLGSTHSDFKSGSAKIEGNIKFQELFDLKPYLTDELQAQHKNMLCRLFAVIVHAGKNSHSGHYIAYVRSLSKTATKNDWWKMDDGRVTPASTLEVLRSEAYMLFYRVVQHPVATRLENEYKLKVTAAAALNKDPLMNNNDDDDGFPEPEATNATETATTTPAAAAAAVPAVASSSVTVPRRSNRKRSAPPEFETGEDWARAKTTFPPPFIDFLKKLQEQCFADNVVWTKDFIQNILETEASKENARVGKYPKNSSANVDDLEGGADPVRVHFHRFFKGLAEIFEKQDYMDTLMSYLTSDKKNEVSTTSTTNTITTKITSSTSTLTGADEKRVAVVEPEEEMALL